MIQCPPPPRKRTPQMVHLLIPSSGITMMNLFKRSHHHSSNRNRARSPSSFEIPKLCLTRQKRSASIDSTETTVKTLELPASDSRMRSSSFDSSTLHHQVESSPDLLQVPASSSSACIADDVGSLSLHGSRRSNSFDNASQWYALNSSDDNSSDKECQYNLTVPKAQLRRASWEIPKICLHCLHIETLAKEQRESESSGPKFFLGESAETLVLSSASHSAGSSDVSTCDSNEDLYASDSESSDNPNLNVRFHDDITAGCSVPEAEAGTILQLQKHRIRINNESIDDLNLIEAPCRSVIGDPSSPEGDQISYTDVVTLAVPVMKQRSSSLDATCMMGSPKKSSLEEERRGSPGKKQARSKSMDSNMPRKGSATAALLALVQQSFK